MPPVLTVRRCGATTRRQTTRASTGSGSASPTARSRCTASPGLAPAVVCTNNPPRETFSTMPECELPVTWRRHGTRFRKRGSTAVCMRGYFGRTRGGLEPQRPRNPGRAERSAIARAASQSGTLTRSAFSKPSPAVSPARQRA